MVPGSNIRYLFNMKRDNYFNQKFPLLPKLLRTGVGVSPKHFSFSWLFFKFWTLTSPSLEIAITIDTKIGIGIHGQLLYLKYIIAIPAPMFLDKFVYDYLTRKRKI